MSEKLVITEIKQGTRNQNRVNVFINHDYAFSLDLPQLVDYKLKLGQELEKLDIEKYKHASEFGKLRQRTLEWVLTRQRSTRETKDYLKRKIHEKNLEQEDADAIISELIAKKYLDDEQFAEYYVENRFIKKGISTKRLKLELFKKGISTETVEKVFAKGIRSDEEEIKKIIIKKYKKYDDNNKLIEYLTRQGFDFELARNLVRDFYETDLRNLE